MRKIDKKIQAARPLFKSVSPLGYGIALGVTVTNFAIAPAFLLMPDNRLIVVDGLLGNWFCFGIFISLSFAMTYALHKNNWALIRKVVAVDITFKSIIFYALLFNLFTHGLTSYGVTVLWAVLVYFQAILLICPIPVVPVIPESKA